MEQILRFQAFVIRNWKFWFTFIVNLCSLSFCDFRKNVPDQNDPYINMLQTKKYYLCVDYSGILSVVVCDLWPDFYLHELM